MLSLDAGGFHHYILYMNYLYRLLSGALLLIIMVSCSDMGEPEILLPEINVEPLSLNFSTVTIGSPQTRQVMVINAGEGELNGTLSLIQDSSTFSILPAGDFLVLPEDTLLIDVTFIPQAASAYTGQILVNSDDLEIPDWEVNLSGTGTAIPVPALSLSTSNLNFGTILSTESSQLPVTLTNTGNDTLELTTISFDLDVYSVDVSMPLELSPGSSRIATVTFQPNGAGIFDGDMTITSNSPSSPDVVTLNAAAEAVVSYATSVQPVWNASCGGCHGSNGGLSLTSYTNLMAGTSSNGPVVIAGDGANSLIVQRIKGQVGSRMPQGGASLSATTIETIETWINQGAMDN